MNCPRCFGAGTIRVPTDQWVQHALQCPQCEGVGIIHCCEGERPNDATCAALHAADRIMKRRKNALAALSKQ